jgi:hypothetical protein
VPLESLADGAPPPLFEPRCEATLDPRVTDHPAEGTAWQEIDPDFFQPSFRSQLRGWYTISGS